MDDWVEFTFMVFSDSTKPEQPPGIMTAPNEFFPAVGRIILNWGVLEQEMDALISATMAVNGTANPGIGRREFKKRWALLKDEWTTFADGDARLNREMDLATREMHKGKFLRDCLSHKRMTCGLHNGRPFLCFANDSEIRPQTKRFFESDLDEIALAIMFSAGRLYRLMHLDYAEHFEPQSISLLQRLPDMDHLRTPMLPKQKRPPRS